MIRRFCLSLVLGVFLSSALCQVAHAGLVFSADQLLDSTDSGANVQLGLVNYETINEDGATPGILEVGDTLRGIFRITTGISNGVGRTITGFELTGIFETEVASITPNSIGTALGNSYSNITFKPTASFESVYGTGAMLAFYEDPSEDFTPIGSIASTEASATNGDLYAVFGGLGTFGVDYFWTSNGYADVSENATAPIPTTFAASLQLISQPGTNLLFKDNQTQTQSAEFPASYASIANELVLQGNVTAIKPGDLIGSPYPLQSNDPVRVFAVVPEPASLLAWGGLCLFGGVGYRRRRNRK